MTLGELIETLEKYPPEQAVPVGFDEACSYRGYYEELGLVVCKATTVGSMLTVAKAANGERFEGYKGGSYKMGDTCDVYLVEDPSACGEQIGPYLLRAWLGDPPKPPPALLVTRASVVALLMARRTDPDLGQHALDVLEKTAIKVKAGTAGLEGMVF